MAFIVERSMKRNVLDFKAADERIRILRINIKLQTVSFIKVHDPTEEKKRK